MGSQLAGAHEYDALIKFQVAEDEVCILGAEKPRVTEPWVAFSVEFREKINN